ncbi:MAG TPA: 30S ribosomal protein S8 [Candidatus Dojkabacteria bacterium]|nr:30S ribosomal protein S8 [Candidatus Dojkabacteria bacterium]
MVNDTIADLLARIQNGIIAKKEEILAPVTKMGREILRVLKQENMITDYTEADGNFTITLMYREDGQPEIEKLQRFSKPGQRRYISSYEITPIMNGRGISIISTSMGVMTGAQAKSKKLGGELICKVW